jgi:hypothetical protein
MPSCSSPAAGGTSIAVVADANADAGQVAYEMAVPVKRVGRQINADPRNIRHDAPA